MGLVLVNDPQRPLSNPLPRIGELLRSGDASQALRASLELNHDTIQGEMLSALGSNEILTYAEADGFPLPATEDREGYWGDDHLSYWISGLGDFLFLNSLVTKFCNPDPRSELSVLDLGCASGRVLRHFAIGGRGLRLYGADINRNNLAFVRRYLPETLICLQNTIVPPLPLEENSIDFLYGLSVFTHIHDFEEAWLLDIRRMLKPGGAALLTFHSERTWTELKPTHFLFKHFSATSHRVEFLRRDPVEFEPGILGSEMPDGKVVFVMKDYPVNNTNVFCSHDYIRRMWGRVLEVDSFYSKVHGTHQDGVVLRKL